MIHSFWVPEFRVKQDALPGENLVKELRMTPNVIGDYTVMCAELCGGAHAYMNSPVRVVSQADFDAWIAEQSNAAAHAAQQSAARRWQKARAAWPATRWMAHKLVRADLEGTGRR